MDIINLVIDASCQAYKAELGDRDALPEEEAIKLYRRACDELTPGLSSLMGGCSEVELESWFDRGCATFLSCVLTTKADSMAISQDVSEPWVGKRDIEWNYFDRYKSYLKQKKWPNAAIASIEDSSENILDFLGDPTNDDPFERRGLVVASVQSGKTANYIGLISRAADAGYKVIVLLAGVLDALRNQTQMRVNEGFVDAEPDELNVPKPISFTAKDGDFNEASATTTLRLARNQYNSDCPMIFVVKKNASILNNVYNWIKNNIHDGEPILLIDDEADNASINVNYKSRDEEDYEPSSINRSIRQILSTSTKNAYVGYTATPYANVFIDPTDTDLFPKNFVYTLGDSSNYFGAKKLFVSEEEGGAREKHLRIVDDAEGWIPSKRGDYSPVEGMPLSLEKAIRTFVLATALRNLRGDGGQHSSMLVNVSPANQIQEEVSFLVQAYLSRIKEDVRSFGYLSEEEACEQSRIIRTLKETYDQEYAWEEKARWADLLRSMADNVGDIRVVLRNSKSNDVLDYSKATEKVIVVGGYALSRGLTLEGLVVSYYLRNARAYDTLMQMCRWFGYRGGYEDLCRVWMTEESAAWYEYVAEATDSLYDEFRRMSQKGRTPRNFKLRVMSSPFTLRITAPDKSGAMLEERKIHLDGELVETTSLEISKTSDATENAEKLVQDLRRSGFGPTPKDELPNENRGIYVVENVPVAIVRDFIGRSAECGASISEGNQSLLDFIDDPGDEELSFWDILFVSGKGSPWFELPDGSTLPAVTRKANQRRLDEGRVLVSNKGRLGSPSDEKAGLTQEQIAKAWREAEDRGIQKPSGHLFRQNRKKPLLMVYPLEVFDSNSTGTGNWPLRTVGWGVSLPLIGRRAEQTYAVNELVDELVELGLVDTDVEKDEW